MYIYYKDYGKTICAVCFVLTGSDYSVSNKYTTLALILLLSMFCCFLPPLPPLSPLLPLLLVIVVVICRGFALQFYDLLLSLCLVANRSRQANAVEGGEERGERVLVVDLPFSYICWLFMTASSGCCGLQVFVHVCLYRTR